MTDAPERIWATPFDPEVMEGGTYCDAAARPTAPNHDAWCYIRADLSSPLGAVAMRDAALKAIMDIWAELLPKMSELELQHPAQSEIDAIAALPLPDHATLLAHAMRLPEVAAMVKSAFVEGFDLGYVEYPERALRPWLAETADQAWQSSTTLDALEARHE